MYTVKYETVDMNKAVVAVKRVEFSEAVSVFNSLCVDGSGRWVIMFDEQTKQQVPGYNWRD